MTDEPPTVNLKDYIAERRDDYKDPEYSNDSSDSDTSSSKVYGIKIDFSNPFKEKSMGDRYDDVDYADGESPLEETVKEPIIQEEIFKIEYRLAA
jgi:hypothetical protein